VVAVWRVKQAQFAGVKHWTFVAAKLTASGLSWGCSSEIDATGRVLYTADAYCKDGKRFTVISDDKLTASLELERIAQIDFRTPSAERREKWRCP
jgi:hypothetical protein